MNKPFRINAVLFDFDGTLTEQDALDFSVIKDILGCPKELPVLEFIAGISDQQQKNEAFKKLNGFENDGAKKSKPNPGAEELIRYIRSKGLFTGLITRNSLESVKIALNNFDHIDLSEFDIVITRDEPVAPKPSPDGILLAARKLKIASENILMVGDFVFDIEAGNRASAVTVLLDINSRVDKDLMQCDFIVSHLKEVKHIVKMGLPLEQGKLPNELLEIFLDRFAFNDPELLIPPGIGEDIAAADIRNDEVLILKSDPITFVTDAIGRYAVLVNANDIATSGATPRWLLTTLLFPLGSTGSDISFVMNELNEISNAYGLQLCGGHTEITDAVARPVVIGALAGTVKRNRLIDKQSMRPGDKVLLTKSVAVEGTALIAREFEEKLLAKGVPAAEIETGKRFLDLISILEEAKIATDTGDVTAMHDITEGGLATAVTELSIAGRHRIKIEMNRIPLFNQTVQICNALQISPLGLIGSGSLLICCKPNSQNDIMGRIRAAGIDIACIGEVMDRGTGVVAMDGSRQVEWPRFEVDELTRLFREA